MKVRARAGVVLVLAAATILIPALPAMAAPSPQIAQVIVDGDPLATIHPEDTFELTIDLWNDGDEIASGVTGVLGSFDDEVEVVSGDPVSYPDIEVDNQATPASPAEPFRIAVGTPLFCTVQMNFGVFTDQGDFMIPFDLVVEPCEPGALIALGAVTMIDAETGQSLDDLTVGRSIELRVGLSNIGEQDAEEVSAVLRAPEGNADVSDSTAAYGSLPVGETAPGGFRLTMTECDPLGLHLELDVEGARTVEADNGTTPLPQGTLPIRLETRCPGTHLIFHGASYDDTEGGNGDGVPQPGETISVRIQIENDGADVLSGLVGTFTAENADVLQASSEFPDVAPRERVENTTPFVMRVHDDAPTFTVGESDTGCSWFTFGDHGHSLEGPMVIAQVNQELSVLGPDGTVTRAVGGLGAVCVLQNVAGPGELVETGSASGALGAVGISLVLLGWLMRHRAARMLAR